MKQISITFIALLFSVTALFAQTQNQPSKQVLNEIQILTKADLNLSDIQISRITSVLMAQEQILVRNAHSLEGNKTVVDQRMKELKANKISNIKGALTPQQLEKFNALKLEEKF
jgi:hypothetical protein